MSNSWLEWVTICGNFVALVFQNFLAAKDGYLRQNHMLKDTGLGLIVKLGSRSKVYLKSLRDLDLELEAIFAMPPTHHPLNFSEQNNIEISSCMN